MFNFNVETMRTTLLQETIKRLNGIAKLISLLEQHNDPNIVSATLLALNKYMIMNSMSRKVFFTIC